MRRSFALLVLFLVASILAGCSGSAQPVEEQTPTPLPAPPRPTVQVQRGLVVQETEFMARVEPVQSQEIAFQTSGKIRNVYVEQNDPVETGQVIADLDTLDELEEQLAQARLEAQMRMQEVQEVLRRAEIRFEIAQLNYQVTQEQEKSAEEIRIAELELELAQMDLDEVRSNLEEAESPGEIEALEAAVEEALLVATTDGFMLTSLTPGRNVSRGATVAVIGDLAELELVAGVDLQLLEQLAEGMPVEVIFPDHSSQVLPGTICELPYPYGTGPAGSGSEDIRICVEALENEEAYQVGDQAQVNVVLAQKDDALWLPPQAVRSVAGRSFVIVDGPAGVTRVDVTVGIAGRDRVEIVEGLAEGQTVVVP